MAPFSKLTKPGLVENIMDVAFLFVLMFVKNSHRGLTPPPPPPPPPLIQVVATQNWPPPDRVSKRPVARTRGAHEDDASTVARTAMGKRALRLTPLEMTPPPPPPVGSDVEVNVTADVAAEASQIGINICTTMHHHRVRRRRGHDAPKSRRPSNEHFP
jgi:hypothetical protein